MLQEIDQGAGRHRTSIEIFLDEQIELPGIREVHRVRLETTLTEVLHALRADVEADVGQAEVPQRFCDGSMTTAEIEHNLSIAGTMPLHEVYNV